MRRPAVAGMFYPQGEKALKKEIERCVRKGPGSKPRTIGRPIGIISPHAGYTYSGPTAAYGFMSLKGHDSPETAIVIGPNHHGNGIPVAALADDLETPLGVSKADTELIKKIGVKTDDRAHESEHSMEVQIPFLQYLFPRIRQVCISMSDQSLQTSKGLGNGIASAVNGTGRNVVLVASSDLTHCGWNYGYPVPPGMNAGEFARSRDQPVIDRLLEMDIEGAYKRKKELGTTACGMGPIAAVMTASKYLGAKTAKLLDYTSSYDVMPAESAVGYASIILL